MQSDEPIATGPLPPSTEGGAAPTAGLPDSAPIRTGRVWGFALAAGLLAGVLSGMIGELIFETFRPGLVPEVVMGQTSMIPPPHEIAAATRKNAALTFGLMGGILSMALGLAGGLAARHGTKASWVALAGLAAGSLATAASAWLIVPEYYRYAVRVEANQGENLLVPLLVHMGIWATAGAAGGLAFGFGLGPGDRNLALRTLIGGLAGAALGAVAYEILGGIAFPMDKTPQPFAKSWMPRALAPLLGCVFASAFAAFAATDAVRDRRTT